MVEETSKAKSPLLLAIDQGTSSSRAIVFNANGKPLTTAQQSFPQIYPSSSEVEHDPEAIWQSTIHSCKQALQQTGNASEVAAIGITNQRETTLLWERDSGKPLANAIVWQDRRTSEYCNGLRDKDLEPLIQAKTGLRLDPYFSASKLHWLLTNISGARLRAEQGKLCFGTVDSFLLYRLTGGRVHATDATNASRTGLYNIHTGQWDAELLNIYDIPASLLPSVHDCSHDYGYTDKNIVGRCIPILGMAGDQQAAAIGQTCFQPGDSKCTLGTGAFILTNTGHEAKVSQHKLLTTIAYQFSGQPSYALEGSIFIAGAGVQWLRDELGLIKRAEETEALAASLSGNDGVYLVPAFTGLGAPYWNPDVRGALFGLTRGTGRAHIARATLEAVAYQLVDLVKTIEADGVQLKALRMDGGMLKNQWLMQFICDIIQQPLEATLTTESTALGAAYLAGLQAGLYKDLHSLKQQRQPGQCYQPQMPDNQRVALIQGWHQAIKSLLNNP